MKKDLTGQKKSTAWVLHLAGCAISCLAAVIYLIYSLSVGLFYAPAFVFMLLGGAAFLSTLFLGWECSVILASLLCALGFGFHLYDRVEMFAYMASGIYGMGEKGAVLWIVLLILLLSLAATVFNLFASFQWPYRQQEAQELEIDGPVNHRRNQIIACAVVLVLACGGFFLVRQLGESGDKVPQLTGIEIQTMPSKTVYSIEDFFSDEGMIVSSIYNDGTRGQVTGYDLDLKSALKETDTKVTVKYMGFTAECPITVKEITVGEFKGEGISMTLMEHGAAYIQAEGQEIISGTWANAGEKVFVSFDGQEYDAEHTDHGYSLSLTIEGREYMLQADQMDMLLSGKFTGTSPAGNVSVTLLPDGTLEGSFGSIPIVGNNWKKQGMNIEMEIHMYMEGRLDTLQTCIAQKVNGLYASQIVMESTYHLTSDITLTEEN